MNQETNKNQNTNEEPDGNQTTDEESGDDVPDPSRRKKTKSTSKQRGNGTESEDSHDEGYESATFSEEALSGFGTNAKTDCITVGKTKKDLYINGYGRKHARIYKIEDQPRFNCNEDELPVINDFNVQLGMRKNKAGQFIYTKRHIVDVYGVAFEDDVQNGVYGPDVLDPAEKGDQRWSPMYVWIAWRDPDDPKVVTRTWETRTTARRLWRGKADMMLYLAAWEADKRYNDSGVRSMSRDVTPGLIRNYIAEQRQLSPDIEPPRQSSVLPDDIMPSIEIGSKQHQSHSRGIKAQPQRASKSSRSLPPEQRFAQMFMAAFETTLSRMMGMRV